MLIIGALSLVTLGLVYVLGLVTGRALERGAAESIEPAGRHARQPIPDDAVRLTVPLRHVRAGNAPTALLEPPTDPLRADGAPVSRSAPSPVDQEPAPRLADAQCRTVYLVARHRAIYG